MGKSKQRNFYLNPEEDKDIIDFLESIPKMARSSFIKGLIRNRIHESKPFTFNPFQQLQAKVLNGENFEIELDDI